MSDFDELKKKVNTFLEEVKVFYAGIPKTSTEVERHQAKFVELRAQHEAYINEVQEFKPAKSIMLLDFKKSSLVKSLQSELLKASKTMEKHKIPIPPAPEAATAEGTVEPSTSAPEAANTAPDTPTKATTAPAPTPTPTAAPSTTTAAAPPPTAEVPAPKPRVKAEVKDKENEEGSGEEEEEEDEDFEEEEEEEEEEAEAEAAQPQPAPRQRTAQQLQPQTPQTNGVPRPVNGREDGSEEEDEEVEDEEEDEEDDMQPVGPDEPNEYEVLQDYAGKDAEMLTIKAGEELVVLKKGGDGWWLAKNTKGREGLVPSTLLRVIDDSEGEEGEEDEEDDNEINAHSAAAVTPPQAAAEQHEQMLSASQLKPGLPTGFRSSTLAKWLYEGTQQFTMLALLLPKLSPSCSMLQDSQLKPSTSRVEKILQLQKCTFMPSELPVNVVDRYIRMCLFDGQGPVSNVHTVRATVAGGKDERNWTFSNRLADTTPGLEFGEAYLKYNHASNHVRLLLEATIVCSDQSTDGSEKLVELSIGHVTIPLCDENGAPVPARAFDLQLEGGTPFEQQVEVDPNLTKASGQSTGLFKSSANKPPRIQGKFSAPSREMKEFMDTCPSTIIGNIAHLQLHSLYRTILAIELGSGSRILERNAAPIYSPCLAQFPIMADQPDLMDLIRRRWNDFAKRDRVFRKPQATEVMKQEFIRTVNSTYFLNQLKDFQPYVFGNKVHEQSRANQIQDFQRRVATDPSGVGFSLSPDFVFEPFSLQEASLPVLGPHSVPVIPVAVE